MKTLLCAFLMCVPTICSAQATPGGTAAQFAVKGAGRLECSTYTSARKNKGSAEFQRLMGFIEGYITAANRYEPDTFDLSPWHNAMAFDIIVSNYCKDHEKTPLVNVVQQMVTGFRTIRVAKFSPLVEVGTGKDRAFVYEAVLRRSQQALKVRGLYAGTEDGHYSKPLSDAFASFQKSKGLQATGVPDPATLWMLLNP